MTNVIVKVSQKDQMASALIQYGFIDKSKMILDICDVLVENNEGLRFELDFFFHGTDITLSIKTEKGSNLSFKK